MALVAVIADTHLPRGSRRLADECVRRLAAADLILHAGDLTSLAFLEELRGLGPPVHAVHGNADEAALRGLLPARAVVEVEGVRVGLVHEPGRANGRDERLAGSFPGCDVVVYGHTHTAHVARAGPVLVLNPGSPTERRRSPSRSMAELRLDGGGVEARLLELP